MPGPGRAGQFQTPNRSRGCRGRSSMVEDPFRPFRRPTEWGGPGESRHAAGCQRGLHGYRQNASARCRSRTPRSGFRRSGHTRSAARIPPKSSRPPNPSKNCLGLIGRIRVNRGLSIDYKKICNSPRLSARRGPSPLARPLSGGQDLACMQIRGCVICFSGSIRRLWIDFLATES